MKYDTSGLRIPPLRDVGLVNCGLMEKNKRASAEAMQCYMYSGLRVMRENRYIIFIADAARSAPYEDY